MVKKMTEKELDDTLKNIRYFTNDLIQHENYIDEETYKLINQAWEKLLTANQRIQRIVKIKNTN